MTNKLIPILLIVLFMSACNGTSAQTVEVTRLVSQTSVVTQIITGTPKPSETPGNPQNQAAVVNEAEIALIQYYTLLNYHMFPEAYQFYSQYRPGGLQSYDRWFEIASEITSVKILEVLPYNEYAKKYEYPLLEDRSDFSTFGVSIIMYGKGNMVGAALSGEKQFFFVNMSLDNGLWKIYSTQTDRPSIPR